MRARLTLIVKQTQTDTATADSTGLRYVTPPTFRMPVTIVVETDSGTVTRHAQLKQREDTIEIGGVKSGPTMVIFDDGNTILKTLEFAQPVPWLARQLERDPDLWNRHWAIEQLVAQLPDSAAAAALVRAATSSDYFLTRMEAADSLGGAPAAVAMPALERAMGDTSAQVRSAAVKSLARVGGDRATQLVRRAWTSDTSYEVRAQAVMALAKLDQAGRRAAIAQGLATPSYQNTITNSAYGAIVQANDTTFIPQVDSAAGTAIEPSYVLAILGARGNARALDLVVNHLDDERPAVRRWALTAITNVLPDTVAAARLTAVKDQLRHADSKAAVQKAIDQLSARRGTGGP